MLTGLISVKVVAVIIGPSGIALLGQLNNFSAIIMSIASGGINSGITKYVAEHKESESTVKQYLSTALRITVGCSLFAGVLMIIFHRFLSNCIMLSTEYGYVFVIFGCTVLLYALNGMLVSILNGYKEFKKFVWVNIATSIAGLVFTLSFVLTLGLEGALISAVTFQSIMFFVTLFMIRKLSWFSWTFFKEKLSSEIAKKYFSYTLMAFITAATVPVSQMLLRGYVISEISVVEAGWWEAMNRISNMYLMIITSSFSVYYLPRLSELTGSKELRREIFNAYKVILPFLFVGFIAIYLARFIIVDLLFTSDFRPMESLFLWQLLGDFFKISSWLVAFLMIAKSQVNVYIITEILFSFLFIILGYLFINLNGVVGITQAYLVNYVVYFGTMIFMFRKLLFF